MEATKSRTSREITEKQAGGDWKDGTGKAIEACFALKGVAALFDGYLGSKGGEVIFTPDQMEAIGSLLGLIYEAIYQSDLVAGGAA